MDDESPGGRSVCRLVIDTNSFLQLRDLKDIPWHELQPSADRFEILVLRDVVKELDGFKASTNQRRRDRSRAALALIDQLLETSEGYVDLRSGLVEVRLLLAPIRRIDWTSIPFLDPGKVDDQLVAEAIELGAAVFSHDRGPRIVARQLGVTAFKPKDEWLLPEERTEDQRKIAALERQVGLLQSNFPEIRAGFGTPDEPRSSLRLALPVLPPLSEMQIEKLVAVFQLLNPRRVHVPSPDVEDWRTASLGYDRNTLERYEEDYQAYIEGIREDLAHLHLAVKRLRELQSVPVFINNVGGAAAAALRIEFSSSGSVVFAPRRGHSLLKERPSMYRLPPPAPSRDYGETITSSPMWFPRLEQPVDPLELVWVKQPLLSNAASLACGDFRAGRQWTSEVRLLAQKVPVATILTVTIGATNLKAPVKLEAEISFADEARRWTDPDVLELFPTRMHHAFAS